MKRTWCKGKRRSVPRRGTLGWWTQRKDPTLFDELPEVKYGVLGAVGPEDNPYIGTPHWYARMKWDQEHGFADYS